MDLQPCDPLSPRRRRPFPVAGSAHHVPRPHRRPHLLARHRDAHPGILFPLSPAADRHGRRLRRSRSLPLLRLLGAVSGADGDSDRDVRSQPRSRRPRSSFSSTPSFPPGCFLSPSFGSTPKRIPSTSSSSRPSSGTEPSRRRPCGGFAGLSRRLRRQGARLSTPRLAGRRHSGSAHRHGHGRRRQARPLLHLPFQPRTLPRLRRAPSRRS
jgi:hypothetical protein